LGYNSEFSLISQESLVFLSGNAVIKLLGVEVLVHLTNELVGFALTVSYQTQVFYIDVHGLLKFFLVLVVISKLSHQVVVSKIIIIFKRILEVLQCVWGEVSEAEI
jgi:hypothetical protein